LMHKSWDKLSKVPGGKRLFSTLVGKMVPYTGSINPLVEELSPGHAKVSIKDRRAVRNHLKSVHAIALMNLGEAATGMAFNFALPAHYRAIVIKLSIEYFKKSRGKITAECDVAIPDHEGEYEVVADLKNEKGEVTAKVTALWKAGPRPK
jgi:acyl-coenzyme A thioesterase PaaI-like protein